MVNILPERTEDTGIGINFYKMLGQGGQNIKVDRREFIDFEKYFHDIARIHGASPNILLGWFSKVWIE